MALDPPVAGQVINYEYLWLAEHRRGLDEGGKDRPCVVIAALKTDTGKIRVYVAPITHTKQQQRENAIELGSACKKEIQLDKRHCWVVTNEMNVFDWPGTDLRGTEVRTVIRGVVPDATFKEIRDAVFARGHKRELGTVNRNFDGRKALEDLRAKREKSVKPKSRDKGWER